MRGKVVERLLTKPTKLNREVAQQVADQLALFPDKDLPAFHREAILNALHRITQPADSVIWPGGFVMLSKVQVAAIWDGIRGLSRIERPAQVRHAFDLVLLNLRQDTGEVMLTRDEMAEAMGVSPDEVSRAMSLLVRMDVVFQERRRIPGMRGPGPAVWVVNPHAAWNGNLRIRQETAQKRPQPKAAPQPRRPKPKLALVPSPAAE